MNKLDYDKSKFELCQMLILIKMPYIWANVEDNYEKVLSNIILMSIKNNLNWDIPKLVKKERK